MVKLEAAADADWSHLDKPKGRVIGGKYLEELGGELPDDPERPVQKVECDIPLTYTDSETKDDKEWVVLEYAPNDPENPYHWNPKRKWFITFILCGMTLFIGLGTTAYSSGISRMVKDLHSVTEIGQLGLFTFNMTCAITPLFLAPFCEFVGRRLIYVAGFAGYGICFIGLALGKNMATIVCMRMCLGFFGCVGTILVGGTFDDMFIPEERSYPMALFSYIAILGTVAAPIYAGFIDQSIGWRWIEGIQGLSNIPLLVVAVFGLSETRGSVQLGKRAKALRADTGDERWVAKEELETPGMKELLYNSSVKAGIMLATEPVVFFFGLWIAFAWFITFLFLSVIGITFAEKKHWGEGVAGLPYIGLVIGCTLAYALNVFQIRKYSQIREAAGGSIALDHRLYGVMCGGVFFPIGLFIYSFIQYAFVHWIGPCIGLACICFGIFFIFESCYSYTADCYGQNASSAIAGQGFMRNTLGAVSPLFGAQFFHNVGSQYAGLILSIISAFLTVLPFVLYKFGPIIRAKSSRACTFDEDRKYDNEVVPDNNVTSSDFEKQDPSRGEHAEHASSSDGSRKNVEIY